MQNTGASNDNLDLSEVDWDDESDDVGLLTKESVTAAVVTDTDWTAETILSQLRRGNIQLNPRFQRRDAWTRTRKSRFIESLILAFPIPQIVLAEDKRRRGAFIVLDGKQRLLTLRQFAEGSSFGAGESPDEFRKLVLAGLEVRDDLNRYDLRRLEKDPEKLDDLNALLNQTIRTVVVRRWPNEDFLNNVFLRLNTGSVALSPQELRQALHPGPFSDFIDDFAGGSVAVRRALRNRVPDFRMRDVELLLRYCAIRLYLQGYRGNLKAFLDNTLQRLNDEWEQQEQTIMGLAEDFDSSIDATFEIFGSNAFFRWDGSAKRYERRFNRALFDAVMYYFKDEETRGLAIGNRGLVEDALKDLCERDDDFVRSIQSTTKSIGATFSRIAKWGEVLSESIGVDLPKVEPAGDGVATAQNSTGDGNGMRTR